MITTIIAIIGPQVHALERGAVGARLRDEAREAPIPYYSITYDILHYVLLKLFTLLDLCVSSLRRGHANLLCIVPILTDDPRRDSEIHNILHYVTI